MPQTIPYRIGRWSRFALLPFGVRKGHREVIVDDDRLLSRFGWVTTSIALSDVERWDITGPYHWVRAIGIRHSLFQRDISFCGDTSGALRLWLRSPRRISFVRTVSEVYLGVDDLEGLAAHLTEHGIAGEDLRAKP
jgi:hypothetical protein